MKIKGLRRKPLLAIVKGKRHELQFGDVKDIPDEIAELWISRGDAASTEQVITTDKELVKRVKELEKSLDHREAEIGEAAKRIQELEEALETVTAERDELVTNIEELKKGLDDPDNAGE